MGRYFDEYSVGQAFEHSITRTITESDNTWFSALTYNSQPMHIDAEFASRSEFGQRLVNSLLTLGMVVGISVGDTTHGTLVANLAMTDVQFPKPVFHGDTLRVRSKVLSLRPSKSRPGQGIVEFEHQGFNQRGELVATCKRMVLMYCRPTAPG